jgi:hypothetical protein
MTKLLSCPTGRILIHTFVFCNALLHFTKPNTKFYLSALLRFAKGIG